MTDVSKFNNQSFGEELANAVTHGIGAVLSLIGTVLLVQKASINKELVDVIGCAIYGFSLIFLYTASCTYHSITNIKAKKILQIVDHCSIFILILGCYVPICLSFLEGTLAYVILTVNVVAALTGVILNAISIKRFHKFSLALYLLMGWSIVTAIKPILANTTRLGFWLMLGGGLCYTIGVIFYGMKRPRYMHTIWHLFVLGGSILHFFFMFYFVAQ